MSSVITCFFQKSARKEEQLEIPHQTDLSLDDAVEYAAQYLGQKFESIKRFTLNVDGLTYTQTWFPPEKSTAKKKPVGGR